MRAFGCGEGLLCRVVLTVPEPFRHVTQPPPPPSCTNKRTEGVRGRDGWLRGWERCCRFVRKGTVLHNYAHIFQLLSRLRQACDHPALVLLSGKEALGSGDSGVAEGRANAAVDKVGDAAVELAEGRELLALGMGSGGQCGVCLETMEESERAVSACGHGFHSHCIRVVIGAAGEESEAGKTAAAGESPGGSEAMSQRCPVCFVSLQLDLRPGGAG